MKEIEILKHNILSQIKKANLDAKCAERTGNAVAVWEVQKVLEEIDTIIKLT